MATSAQHDEQSTARSSERPIKRTRLTIDISPELRRRIKIAAAQQDTTVRDYIETILDQAVPEVSQRSVATHEWLERLHQVRDEISQGRTLPDSVELIQQMREERTEHLMRVIEESAMRE